MLLSVSKLKARFINKNPQFPTKLAKQIVINCYSYNGIQKIPMIINSIKKKKPKSYKKTAHLTKKTIRKILFA